MGSTDSDSKRVAACTLYEFFYFIRTCVALLAGFDDDFVGVGLKPGVAFKVNEKISVVTHIGFIGYEHWKNKPSKNSVNSWGVDVDGRNIILGIYYNI